MVMIDDVHLTAFPSEHPATTSPQGAVSGEPLVPGLDECASSDDGEEGIASGVPAKPRRRRRYAKRALLVVVVLFIPVGYSYVRALTGPGNDSLQARTVEWARDNHLGGVVDRVEKYWYAHHQAKVGGAPTANADALGIQPVGVAATSVGGTPTAATSVAVPGVGVAQKSPNAGGSVGTATTVSSSSSPASSNSAAGQTGAGPSAIPTNAATPAPAITVAPAGGPNLPAPLISPAPDPVANEGTWSGIGAQVGGRYGAYATLIRPDAVHTSILDAVVWMDPSALSLRHYPGTKIPGAPWDRPDFVEPQRQSTLVAAFAGGFRLQDSHGGMFLGGNQLKPMRDGGATFVINADGVPNIGIWGRDFTTTDGLDSARQNLDLIVDGGVVSPQLATDANRTWGFTGPANKDAVWRSGAGITATGALVWVGGDGLSIVSLANTLVRAGAVRGMQLDINHKWVQFNTYSIASSGVVHGQKLLGAMQHSGDRFLSEDTRDFVAVFERKR